MGENGAQTQVNLDQIKKDKMVLLHFPHIK